MMSRENNSDKFNSLRKQYPVFRYTSYEIELDSQTNSIIVEFEYICGEHIFKPQLTFELDTPFVSANISQKQLASLVFNMGMVELISYWKAFGSPQVMIEVGSLTSKQIDFWKKLYFNGLGEYFYLNSIDTNIDDFMSIKTQGYQYDRHSYFLKDRVIVPIGGGKDSVVTMELLRRNGYDILPLIINPRGATLSSIEKAGIDENKFIRIKRTIDKSLIELNKIGFLNGHTPFSAMLAFTTLLASAITGIKHIALSNESSANESTVIGEDVNHQYSKSLEFENDFREYVREFISEDFNYFSFLRPLSELQIAQYFSSFDNYHSVFRSCNVGSKTDIWCCNCPKCLFAFIILSPFISNDRLKDYFGDNLLDKLYLKKYFDELCGKSDNKPFECVGTIEEVNIALSLLVERYPESKDFELVKLWLKEGNIISKDLCLDALLFLEKEHNLDDKFFPILKNTYAEYIKSEIFREFSDKSIMIFGFGKEGISTYKFLREIMPQKKIGIQDNNVELVNIDYLSNDYKAGLLDFYLGDDSNYSQQGYDVIIKSPGVCLSKMIKPYDEKLITSQIDIFLDLYSEQCIGVTGTKGKSTTSNLIFQAIKGYTDNVYLAGNIGLPVFDLINNIDKDSIIVLELSAHQLQYITKAPRISVLLNLYEEHLDYFTSYEDYILSKFNIYLKQNGGVFIYNQEDNTICNYLKNLVEGVDSKLVGVLKEQETLKIKYLKGEHNKFNALIALSVAQQMGVLTEKGIENVLNFKGLAHRLQFVCKKDGVEYYNDSISTVPQATLAALAALGNVTTLILGGMDRGIDYMPFVEHLHKYGVKNIAFVSEAGKRIKELLEDSDILSYNYILSSDYKDIVQWCKDVTPNGSICLLSPAAPSYDMFKNFEERGNIFMKLLI